MPNIIHGDAINELALLPANSIDATITDPPYGLAPLAPRTVRKVIEHWKAGDFAYLPTFGKGFMGNDWDRFVPPPKLWQEVARVTKDGGIVAAFAGSRTVDLMMLSMHTAGLTILGVTEWVNAQGFPKSHRVDKDIDKLLGAERQLRVDERWAKRYPNGAGGNLSGDGRALHYEQAQRIEGIRLTSDAVTDEAKQWTGWGTAIKPTHEPIVIACAGTPTRPLSIPSMRYQPKAKANERPKYVAPDGTVITHPTTKPIAVMEWLIDTFTSPGDHVLDTCAGSGTTAEACLRTGRDYTVIESNDEYLPLINQRLNNRQQTLSEAAA